LKTILLSLSCLLGIVSCSPDFPIYKPIMPHKGFTENVFVIVMDGARYHETLGDDSLQYIPLLGTLMSQATVCNNFFNTGKTLTNPAHACMTTGFYQYIDNSGIHLPTKPSLMQYMIEGHPEDSSRAWVIASKGKLSVLGNTSDDVYHDKYVPKINVGSSGNGGDNRTDEATLSIVKTVVSKYKPKLTYILYKEPDESGHTGNWDNYTTAIKKTDSIIYQTVTCILLDPHYQNNTAIFIVNDHGRHNDSNGGFINHGDDCTGCQHIMCMAIGPDFKQGVQITNTYQLTDLAPTIAAMLGIPLPSCQGIVMEAIFKE